ncbi:hypothetical protein [Nocardioides speluncae]|uniref:hypothetical protein n=1 Tax=Nocardioides speluncae TaxID=2670337 RepID=UPI00137940DF|nr:hypothetical protein [Nocardioides speluncae]
MTPTRGTLLLQAPSGELRTTLVWPTCAAPTGLPPVVLLVADQEQPDLAEDIESAAADAGLLVVTVTDPLPPPADAFSYVLGWLADHAVDLGSDRPIRGGPLSRWMPPRQSPHQ